MKTISPVTLVLIAGILSPIVAQLDETYRQSECNVNGGPGAYENMIIGTEDIGNNTVKPIFREILRAYYGSGNEIAPALTVYCTKLEDLNNAIIRYVETIRPCMKPEEREIPNLSNVTASMLQFPCTERNLMEAIHNSTDRQCFNSKSHALSTCLSDIFSRPNTTISTTDSTRRETGCRDVQTFEQCTVRIFGECEDKIFSTALDSLYKYVNNDITSCENLPKTPK